MKPISIYAITREQDLSSLQKLEQHLSGRQHPLPIKAWELETMKALVTNLETHMSDIYSLRLYYSFQIPHLGKEFDLLQIKEDQILNIELKSGAVSDEAIRKQLLQNRYYLSALRRSIVSFTYISSQKRLVRLTKHGRIVTAKWEELCTVLSRNSKDYEGNIEDLFRANLYLISPLTQPGRFLKKEYFLTSQQREIERQILKRLRSVWKGVFCFTGLPGTGKSLLLYDLAMKLSTRQKVCIIHCGKDCEDWELLNQRLRRIDFLTDTQIYLEKPEHAKQYFQKYSAILVDESHLLTADLAKGLFQVSKKKPVLFSSDSEDMISREELNSSAVQIFENLPDTMLFHLTNRICTNAELSVFIRNMMHLPQKNYRWKCQHIAVMYANNDLEAEHLLNDCIRHGYLYRKRESQVKSNYLVIRDVESLAVLLDEHYYYDEEGYLRSNYRQEHCISEVRWLFHQMNLITKELIVIVKGNVDVYNKLLSLLI